MNAKMIIGMLLIPLFAIMIATFENEFPDIKAIPYIGSALIMLSFALFLYGGKELDENSYN